VKVNNNVHEDVLRVKNVRAQEVKLRLEKQMLHDKQVKALESELKRAKQVTYNVRSQMKKKVCKGKTVEQKLCHAIEESCSEILPGKHCKSKALALMSALQSETLLKGEMSVALCDYKKEFIRNMFRPSRLLKACDMGAIGSFRTGTIESLREIIDEEKQGLFLPQQL
jgi:hypothetical protein